MEAVDPMAVEDFTEVEAGSMVEAVRTAVEDFTEVVGSTAADFMAAGFVAGAASVAEWDLAAAAGFVAARSAEERDFAVEGSAAAFAVTASTAAGAGADGVGEDEVGADEVGIGTIGASVLAGAGLMDIGPDMRIRTDMGTTRGGLRPMTVFLLMIPTMILTILTILTMTRHLHTQIGLTRIAIGTAGTRIRHRRALQ
jgi:hypothetical protein